MSNLSKLVSSTPVVYLPAPWCRAPYEWNRTKLYCPSVWAAIGWLGSTPAGPGASIATWVAHPSRSLSSLYVMECISPGFIEVDSTFWANFGFETADHPFAATGILARVRKYAIVTELYYEDSRLDNLYQTQ